MKLLPVAVAALLLIPVSPVARAEEMPTFRLTIRQVHFIPEAMEVPAGRKFRLLLKNEGPGPEEFESAELRKEKVLAEGAESFLIFQPLAPGSYPFFGEFHPSTARGRIIAR